jgi:4-amino-4-deoxy-L-arabinose transferase-like glycosyltransferase
MLRSVRRSLGPVVAIAFAAAVVRALLVAGLELYSDEAYYFLWSLRPDFGYFDHPPLVAWLIAATARWVPGEVGVRLFFFACGGLAVLFCALTARELTDDRRAPLLAALLCASAPLLVLLGALALPDAPLAAAYAAATWLIAGAGRAGRGGGRTWLWAGVAVGLSLLSKYTAALLAPALLLAVLWDPTLRAELKKPWPWLGAAVATAIFLPCLLWNASHGWESIAFQLRHGFGGGGGGATPASFAGHLGALLLGAGPVPAVLGIALLARAKTPAEKRVAAATLVPIAVVTFSALRGKVESNWAAHAYPGLAAAAGVMLTRMRPARMGGFAFASLTLGLALALVFALEERHPFFIDPRSPALERFHGWKELGEKAKAATGEVKDPFIACTSYRYAGELAFYSGFRRFGPATERISQLDVWSDRPRDGEPFFFVGVSGPDAAFAAMWPGAEPGPAIDISPVFAGVKVRGATVSAIPAFRGLATRQRE